MDEGLAVLERARERHARARLSRLECRADVNALLQRGARTDEILRLVAIDRPTFERVVQGLERHPVGAGEAAEALILRATVK